MNTQAIARSPLSTPTLAVGIVAASLGMLSVLPFIGLLLAPLAFIAGLAAVVVGHIALAKSGDGRAKLGLVLGYVGLGVTVGLLVLRAIVSQL